MAAFNPKPWLSQPAGLQLKISNSETPYKNNRKMPLILDQNQTNKNYIKIFLFLMKYLMKLCYGVILITLNYLVFYSITLKFMVLKYLLVRIYLKTI